MPQIILQYTVTHNRAAGSQFNGQRTSKKTKIRGSGEDRELEVVDSPDGIQA